MHTKKIGEPAVTYWYNLSLNKLELFCFFVQPFSSYKMGMLKKDVYRKKGHMP